MNTSTSRFALLQAAHLQTILGCVNLHFRSESDPGWLLRIVLAEGYPQTEDSSLPRCIVGTEYASAPDKPIQPMDSDTTDIHIVDRMQASGLQVIVTSRTCTNSFRWSLRDRFQIGQKPERCRRRCLHVCLQCTCEICSVQEKIEPFQMYTRSSARSLCPVIIYLLG